jgi:hypothetical protein
VLLIRHCSPFSARQMSWYGPAVDEFRPSLRGCGDDGGPSPLSSVCTRGATRFWPIAELDQTTTDIVTNTRFAAIGALIALLPYCALLPCCAFSDIPGSIYPEDRALEGLNQITLSRLPTFASVIAWSTFASWSASRAPSAGPARARLCPLSEPEGIQRQ